MFVVNERMTYAIMTQKDKTIATYAATTTRGNNKIKNHEMQLNDIITHESNSNSTNLSQIKKISLLFIVKMDYHYNKMCNNNNCTETLMKYANFSFFQVFRCTYRPRVASYRKRQKV